MIAKDLINYMIPPLKMSDGLERAQQWMEELRVSELPVVSDGMFLGILTEAAVYDNLNPDASVDDLLLIGSKSSVYENQHYYEVLRMSYKEGVSLVAVKDGEEKFKGVVSVKDVVEAFAQTSSVRNPGAIIVLAMNYKDYSLAEVSRIIEADKAMILSSYLINDPEDPQKIKLTLKINKEDITHITGSLQNFGFNVEAKFNELDAHSGEKERYDSFMRYLQF